MATIQEISKTELGKEFLAINDRVNSLEMPTKENEIGKKEAIQAKIDLLNKELAKIKKAFTVIDELFLATKQFSGIKINFYNINTNLVTGAITELLTIFGKLAANYIMWKLIVSGPS